MRKGAAIHGMAALGSTSVGQCEEAFDSCSHPIHSAELIYL